MKMRVCMISSVDMNAPYGSTTRPYYISKNLVEFGCEILHICTGPPKNNENGMQYLHKKHYKKGFWIVRTTRDIFRMYRECKNFRPDVLYVHQLSNAMRALPLKYLLKIPFVFDGHGSWVLERGYAPKFKQLMGIKQEEMVSKISDRIIAVSDQHRKVYIDYYNIPPEKIETIKNGVDTEILRPMEPDVEIKRELGISGYDKVIVFTCPRRFFSNDIALKYFFQMIPKIEERVKNMKFVIIGGGPKFEPPSPNVIYTGFVRDLASYINLADVCVAPYPPSAVCGGTRNKVADYFACGKPVVSTEEGIRGFNDAIPDRDFLLASDSNDFIDKLLTVLYDEKLSRKLGENARRLALKYDWKKLSKEVFRVLESIVYKLNQKTFITNSSA